MFILYSINKSYKSQQLFITFYKFILSVANLRNHSLAFRIISTGHVGFEPTSYGVKVRCLSAWRMPYDLYLIFFNWKILAESLEITLDYLSKIMYITSESVSALQIFYPFGYRFVCMY